MRSTEIYHAIRDEIIRGKLNPGERLVEKEICERLGVTRGYVREALKMLGADGFVLLKHGRGATVAKISSQETKDLYEVLALLEAKSVELAAPRLDAGDIQKLIDINAEMKTCIHIENRPTARKIWHEGNLQFHRIFANKSGNNELQNLVENVRWKTFDFRYVFLFEPHFKFFYTQHDQLIDALKNKDFPEAKKIMDDHIKKASEVVLQNLEHTTFI